jgi:hypothetical protein
MPLNTTKSSEYATLLFHRNFNIQQSVIEASYNADLQRQKYTPPTISEDTLLSNTNRKPHTHDYHRQRRQNAQLGCDSRCKFTMQRLSSDELEPSR